MKPGLQFASQSTSKPGSGLCGLNVDFSEEKRAMPLGTCSSRPGEEPRRSLQGHVDVVLWPGVVQGQKPRKRLHGTHL
jgi:hypothetical protein